MESQIQDIPVFLVTNTDMVGYTATTMVSVVKNTKHNVSFYIMDCGLSDFGRRQLRSLQDKFSNITKMAFSRADLKRFEGLSVWYYGLLDAWAALLFPESFPEVKKGVHIESDTLVLDDISELYNIDLEDFTIGACVDIATHKKEEINLDCSKHIYFNMGTVVIDCLKWRKQDITERCINLGKKYGNKFFCLHQDALNIIFSNNKYKLLPSRYNLAERKDHILIYHKQFNEAYFINEWKHPVIVHFSPNKPWRTFSSFYSINRVKYFEEWWYYASMTPYYYGLQNTFIAQRIKDEIKGMRGNFDNFGNSMLDTLPEGHPAKYVVGEGQVLINDSLICTAPPAEPQVTPQPEACIKKYRRYRLLGLPVLKVKISDSGSRRYLLFDYLPLMKVQIRDYGKTITYKLLDFIPLLKIRK
ncbi:glycosyltransferase family 8 protein [uncultured Mailhella sp.]|uniref:glycosyltransferase family 8 protein n=1 Tax=uncultured Mailhella sp. TaxID=1981031 RepID=UPI00262FECE6|nr:glycosyltransferase family 8 protein [uncultured Mailhella sp.]